MHSTLLPGFSECNVTYIIGEVHGKLQGVCYIVSKCRELWSTNGFKLDRHFYPPSVNSAFYFIANARLRKRNKTEPSFAKRWTVNRANSKRAAGACST